MTTSTFSPKASSGVTPRSFGAGSLDDVFISNFVFEGRAVSWPGPPLRKASPLRAEAS